jgi:hypothetical protein
LNDFSRTQKETMAPGANPINLFTSGIYES